MSNTRATAATKGARVPQDHALKAEALGAPVHVELSADSTGAGPLSLDVPRDVVDSYEAISAVYSGFTMPVVQVFSEADREAVQAAATDESGKIRNSLVQRILVAALTQAAQGN